ncbi:hypothetical protein C211_07232 [Stutzerimonas degradans]|nr:hypothetical protein C211_07232 [Stutzerimonas degradans]
MHVLSTRAQLAIGVALILLLAMTRGQHFASVENLPSASWSIFFLAGFYLRPRAMFALLFAEASVLDFASLASGTISDWCLSPAYWALVPAYGSLWLAGRLFAGWQRGDLRSLALLVPTLVAAAFVAYCSLAAASTSSPGATPSRRWPASCRASPSTCRGIWAIWRSTSAPRWCCTSASSRRCA